jgi:hypothetical protein
MPARCQQKTNLKKISAYYFLKSQNGRNQGCSCYFCLLIEESGSIPLTNESQEHVDPELVKIKTLQKVKYTVRCLRA